MTVATVGGLSNSDINPDHSKNQSINNDIPEYLFENGKPLLSLDEFSLIKDSIYEVYDYFSEMDDNVILGDVPVEFLPYVIEIGLRKTLWNRMTDKILVDRYSVNVRAYICENSPIMYRLTQPVLSFFNQKTKYIPIIYLCRTYAKYKNTSELDTELNKLLKIEQ